MAKCTKDKYAYKDQAIAAGKVISRAELDARPYSAYQCTKCRFPDGRKAWHWGHRQASSRRKRW